MRLFFHSSLSWENGVDIFFLSLSVVSESGGWERSSIAISKWKSLSGNVLQFSGWSMRGNVWLVEHPNAINVPSNREKQRRLNFGIWKMLMRRAIEEIGKIHLVFSGKFPFSSSSYAAWILWVMNLFLFLTFPEFGTNFFFYFSGVVRGNTHPLYWKLLNCRIGLNVVVSHSIHFFWGELFLGANIVLKAERRRAMNISKPLKFPISNSVPLSLPLFVILFRKLWGNSNINFETNPASDSEIVFGRQHPRILE